MVARYNTWELLISPHPPRCIVWRFRSLFQNKPHPLSPWICLKNYNIMDYIYWTGLGIVTGYKPLLLDSHAITEILVCGHRRGEKGDDYENFHHHGPSTNKGGKGDLTEDRGGRGLKLGWIGWRGHLQGGGWEDLMITQSTEKCHSDPIFCLFECLLPILWYYNDK